MTELRKQLKEIQEYKRRLLSTIDDLEYQVKVAGKIVDSLAVRIGDLEGIIEEMEAKNV